MPGRVTSAPTQDRPVSCSASSTRPRSTPQYHTLVHGGSSSINHRPLDRSLELSVAMGRRATKDPDPFCPGGMAGLASGPQADGDGPCEPRRPGALLPLPMPRHARNASSSASTQQTTELHKASYSTRDATAQPGFNSALADLADPVLPTRPAGKPVRRLRSHVAAASYVYERWEYCRQASSAGYPPGPGLRGTACLNAIA